MEAPGNRAAALTMVWWAAVNWLEMAAANMNEACVVKVC